MLVGFSEFLSGNDEWEDFHHVTITEKGWLCSCGERGEVYSGHTHGPYTTIEDYRNDLSKLQ